MRDPRSRGARDTRTSEEDSSSTMEQAEAELVQLRECLKAASLEIYARLASQPALEGNATTERKETSANANTNPSGDQSLEMDLLADRIIEERLKRLNAEVGRQLVEEFASEERKEVVRLGREGDFRATAEEEESKGYLVAFDPLDGSQNLAVGLSVGSIFAIFDKSTALPGIDIDIDIDSDTGTSGKQREGCSFEGVENGRGIVAAAYALYSTPLIFCFAYETASGASSVDFYQHDFERDTWMLLKRGHQIPTKGKIYSINEGLCEQWDDLTSAFVSTCLRVSSPSRSVRWMSCMVADVHRSLLQGGCFLYPAPRANCPTVPAKYAAGRLRLLYEAYPLAFIWEKAGGTSLLSLGDAGSRTTPSRSLLDGKLFTGAEEPNGKDLHRRCGVCLLGPYEYSRLVALKGSLPKWIGGTEEDLVKTEEVKVSATARQEIRFLKVALAVGLVVQIALFLR